MAVLPSRLPPLHVKIIRRAGTGDATIAIVPTAPEHRAKALTVINLKGGVGKTHTVWLLAGVCEERGKRVLVIDTDTQGNITRSFLPAGQSPLPGVETLFDARTDTDPTALIRRTRFAHIDLLPSSAVLAAYDLSDQRQWERSDLHFSLAEGLRSIRDSYDYLVFDCPPRLSLGSFAALCASDNVLIPLEAADWGAQGIVQVTAAVNHARERYNPQLHLLGYLVSRFKRSRSYQHSYMAELRKHFGRLAFDTVVPDLAGYEKSVTHSVPITLHAPASREADIARSLFDEIEKRIRQARRGRAEQGQPDVRIGAGAPAA